ncbi:hypothetical protein MRX96_050993 [Rhipicephalus microplus]
MPQKVRMILSISSTETLDSLAWMAYKIMNIGKLSISVIERPRESTLSALVREDCLDHLLQANEQLKRKVDQLATELRALK